MPGSTRTLRTGVARGLVELRQGFTGVELAGQLLWPMVTLAALFLVRNRSAGDSDVSLGGWALPSALGMFVTFGMLLMVQHLSAEREDGTLLRAKATPHGIQGYFIGKLVTVSGTILVYLLILLLPGLFLVDGVVVGSIGGWATLLWVLALGLIATQSIGVVIGSLLPSPRAAGYLALPVLGLVGISGIFYPITALADWVQWIAQVFPMYWLGLGMRSAFLPNDAVSVEIGASWRHLETGAVLGAWALLGLIVAPVVLRRMARRESGSRVAARREKLLQRVG
ncbi:ABC transporter permease [Phytoactinopolyspora limicola]|uniref:ABC transporter permease n=1 Tax=Phytoactinopolyspora limicola TaxID=2715536 RepID=UPI00140B667A|nr:ABC transporter permease [Phytoactinopolyspora limicola]